ncbi:MAG: PqqD family protein [Deltaproteobacteria bacterium]|nr:PqqD family protein [Deltaproteobacteria bacterium]
MDATAKLKDLAVSDTGFVFDPYSGSTFSANEAGMKILEGLKQGLSRAEIVFALEEHFEVRGDDLARDLDEFVLLLRRNQLVPADFSLS